VLNFLLEATSSTLPYRQTTSTQRPFTRTFSPTPSDSVTHFSW
jgi:hypothetical protein